ncbi:uncharacterized protein LOC126982479 isoform X2 [Eriocheir sinensis]|nr:uncharacterized protein LOC126982479 isoform X2 [Eriocheir sinensis]XP_050690495.1 uncharacterized protein LOC126982479 isoform X2 [Eriocheir sinensis]
MSWFPRLRIAHLLLGATVGLGTACISSGNVMASSTGGGGGQTSKMMYDFRTLASVSDWVESSDTVREPGMSKGAFVLQKTKLFQRAVMFSMLNPQPNGAGFVGFYTDDHWDLGAYSGLELRVRSQGDNRVYKLNLRHNRQGTNEVAYETFYEVPKNEWTNVVLPFSAFKPYWRGQEVPSAGPLNTANITSVTLQIVGGVYSDFKQHGTSSLEIDYIQAVV